MLTLLNTVNKKHSLLYFTFIFAIENYMFYSKYNNYGK